MPASRLGFLVLLLDRYLYFQNETFRILFDLWISHKVWLIGQTFRLKSNRKNYRHLIGTFTLDLTELLRSSQGRAHFVCEHLGNVTGRANITFVIQYDSLYMLIRLTYLCLNLNHSNDQCHCFVRFSCEYIVNDNSCGQQRHCHKHSFKRRLVFVHNHWSQNSFQYF